MLSVISPAKKLNFDEVLDVKDSSPKFQKDANYLAKIARTLSVSDLKNMMKISEELAVLNQRDFKHFRINRKNIKQSKQHSHLQVIHILVWTQEICLLKS